LTRTTATRRTTATSEEGTRVAAIGFSPALARRAAGEVTVELLPEGLPAEVRCRECGDPALVRYVSPAAVPGTVKHSLFCMDCAVELKLLERTYTIPRQYLLSKPWLQTYSGRAFDFLPAEAENINLIDIAHSLAMQCRFNGHTREFYSVAQHSVLVSDVVVQPSDEFYGKGRRTTAIWGLLHDAAEAYCGDLVRPIKQLDPIYQAMEEQVLKAVAEHFGLELPIPASVHRADNQLLATEARDLLVAPPRPWEPLPEPLGVGEGIIPMDPEAAEALFLERAQELGL
jgi:5'-nucleotidase